MTRRRKRPNPHPLYRKDYTLLAVGPLLVSEGIKLLGCIYEEEWIDLKGLRYQRVLKSIRKSGYDNSERIVLGNCRELPITIMNGNHRMRAAHALGIETVMAEVRYVHGGPLIAPDDVPESMRAFLIDSWDERPAEVKHAETD